MIWLTWRQFRVQALVVYVALLALALTLAFTGGELADAYRDSAATFLDRIGADRFDRTLYTVGVLASYVVPGVVGAFWGAPLVARELEAGTHRLAWTQSITRNRWLATKLGLGMVGAMIAGGLTSLAMTWWAHPIDKAVSAGHEANGSIFELARIVPEMFGSRGIAPIGYAAFAFALGVAAGALLRRTVPAIAVTLAVYVLIQIVMPNWVRPFLAEPERETIAITSDNLRGIMGEGPARPIDELEVSFGSAGSWLLSSETVGADGEVVTSVPAWVFGCLPGPGPGVEPGNADDSVQGCFDRLADEGYRQEVTYHPAISYWPLQWREAGVMLLGAMALSALAFWRVKRLS